MRLSRKGFTLIELLVTIIIIGIVVGFSTYGMIKVVNNSKEKAAILTIDNMKEVARIYSTEVSENSWKKEDNYDAFCTTIGEFINKGLLSKDAILDNGISANDYIIVKRNKITLAIESEEIVSNTIGEENNAICTGQIVVESEEINAPIIKDSVSYTDKIIINFTPGNATYNGSDSTVDYKCLYGDTSSNINREGKIIGYSCEIDNLRNNNDYYVNIYMNTNNGSSVLADGNNDYKTADFNDPEIIQTKNIITINYDDSDSNENDIGNASHYFKSNIDGVVGENVQKCILNNNIFSCNGATTDIKSDIWYKVSGSTVNITYPEENSTPKIIARINDGSNNSREVEKNFGISKYIVRFYKNNALSIDNASAIYIEKYCIAESNNSCNIISPTITPQTGYDAVGFNTSSTATTSIWNVSTSKSVSASATYYAITKIKTYTVS